MNEHSSLVFWSSWASIVALAVAVVGFSVTVWQIWKTRQTIGRALTLAADAEVAERATEFVRLTREVSKGCELASQGERSTLLQSWLDAADIFYPYVSRSSLSRSAKRIRETYSAVNTWIDQQDAKRIADVRKRFRRLISQLEMGTRQIELLRKVSGH